MHNFSSSGNHRFCVLFLKMRVANCVLCLYNVLEISVMKENL